MAKRGYTKGKFRPINPKKYNGDWTKIVYRSSWELKLFIKLDTAPRILSWNSEEVVIPYFYELDQKYHRYFMDIWCRVKAADGTVSEMLIEVKPASKTRPPKVQKRQTKRYLTEVAEYIKNQAKWKAASKYCKERNMTFRIFTEKELGIK
jgi:hypothetical protein